MTTENYCFCELAPLYALDLLSEGERHWVEQQIAEYPDLAEELAICQSEVTAIPYSVPALPVATDLKERLFKQLGLDASPPASVPASIPEPYLVVRSQDLDWVPHTTPGVVVAIVHRDEVKRELVGFLRAESGVRYPFHRHAAIEEIFMLEGDLVIGDEVYSAGDYIRSHPGSSHAPYTNGGCRFFFHTSLDDEYPELTGVASL
ncbi:MAG: cupin domain-containing protein [Actinomycetota bacterium]